jgi:hypothetical protein
MNKKLLMYLMSLVLFVLTLHSVAQEIPEKEQLDKIIPALGPDYLSLSGVIRATGGDVGKVFEFVRDNIAFEGYAGALRGVNGTLLAGAGNSWDQAILLKALLDELNIENKIVRSRLPLEYYADLKKLEVQPDVGGEKLADITEKLSIAKEQVVEFDQNLRQFSANIVQEARQEQSNIAFKTRRLFTTPESAIYGDYLWVQAEIGEKLYDFHPCFPKGLTLVLEPLGVMNSLVSVPEEMNHWVRFRCFIERNSGEGLARELILDKKILSSTSTMKALRFSLNPEKDNSGKINLKPSLVKGLTILSGKRLAVRSSDKGNIIGSLTGVWLEVTALSPGERPATYTITLADSLPGKPLWQERKGLDGRQVPVLADEELYSFAEMAVFSTAVSLKASLNYDLELLRQLGKIKNYRSSELSKPRFVNPVLLRWAALLKPVLQTINSGSRAYLNAPAIAAALYKPVANKGQLFLMSWAGITHFRTRGGGEQFLNGIAASLLFEKVAGFKDSLSKANDRTGVKFEYIESDKEILPFQKQWQRITWNELRADIISGDSIYVSAGGKVHSWWRQAKTSDDPILKSERGWLKRWQVVESPLALTRNISGELIFFINNELNDKNEKEVITRAVSRFISIHLSAFSYSPIEILLRNKELGKGNYKITNR